MRTFLRRVSEILVRAKARNHRLHVPAGVAGAVRGKFAFRRPHKCRVTLLPEATLESGMVTFRAQIAPTGLL